MIGSNLLSQTRSQSFPLPPLFGVARTGDPLIMSESRSASRYLVRRSRGVHFDHAGFQPTGYAARVTHRTELRSVNRDGVASGLRYEPRGVSSAASHETSQPRQASLYVSGALPGGKGRKNACPEN